MLETYEYVIVGSGAGGGTLAARLAEYGHTVLLLEAGGDPKTLSGGDPAYPNENRLPDDYDVPCFHAFASENDAMKWDFWVTHYQDPALQRKDDKAVETPHGPRILYPRAGTLGGCAAHNAQITVYPHNKDWDDIAESTHDPSWSSKNMRRYFERLEDCRHRPFWRWVYNLTRINPTRHGFRGWLRSEKAIPPAALDDEKLDRFLLKSIAKAAKDISSPLLERLRWQFFGKGDPNDWRLVKDNATGIRYIPLATEGHVRTSPRERVLDVAKKHPDRLHIELDALATRIVFDANLRATGVEYLKGARLYRAADPNASGGVTRSVNASREVILAGGVFNSPQLLMLSGIGPKEHLEDPKIRIECRFDLPGVGSNLQDRYEVGVVNRMNFPAWWLLKGATFHPGDPQYEEWKTKRTGAYITNGGVLAVIEKSSGEQPLPDLFIFALLGNFRGYFPGYAALFPKGLNYLTWCVLKAHSQNAKGTVRLRSKDPRDPPDIDFHYFEQDPGGKDLESIVEGVKFVRKLTESMRAQKFIAEEEVPGEQIGKDEIADFVKYNSWGHHASCTCAIGSVVDKDFQVYGAKGLRIVDASVFPKIPGFFIVSSIYTIAEKAADVIHQAAGGRL